MQGNNQEFMMGTLKEKTPICIRACSTSQKGIVEYLEMGPQQNEAMVPTVTALVAARVPDITTSLLILKDLKRSEDHSVWQRRKSISTWQQAVLDKMHLMPMQAEITEIEKNNIARRGTMTTVTTATRKDQRKTTKMGKRETIEQRCRNQLYGCVETGLNTSAAQANVTIITARLKYRSGKSPKNGMMEARHLTNPKMGVDQDQSHHLLIQEQVEKSDQDIPTRVRDMMDVVDPVTLSLLGQKSILKNCQNDQNLSPWMLAVLPQSTLVHLDQTLFVVVPYSGVTLQQTLPMRTIIQDIQATLDQLAIQNSNGTMCMVMDQSQVTKPKNETDMKVKAVGH